MPHTQAISETADKIAARFGSAILERVSFRGDETLTIAKETIHEAIRWTRDSLGFNILVNICSVDNFGSDPRFEVVYTLSQAETGVNVTLKTKVNEEEEVDSVVDLFGGANWQEREMWDLMGIKFKNHPDLRRILMWEGYPFHPLRKDFPVQGIPTELEGMAFTEVAPTAGAPFATTPGTCHSGTREARSRQI